MAGYRPLDARWRGPVVARYVVSPAYTALCPGGGKRPGRACSAATPPA
jgi:hypothetical protein